MTKLYGGAAGGMPGGMPGGFPGAQGGAAPGAGGSSGPTIEVISSDRNLPSTEKFIELFFLSFRSLGSRLSQHIALIHLFLDNISLCTCL